MTININTTSPSEPVGLTRARRSERTAELLAAAALPTNALIQRELHDEVLLLNMEVARSMARRFAHRGIDLQDLEQVAFEAMIKAVKRFDASMERDFLSFAVPTIRGELQRHFRDAGWVVRPTRNVQEIQWRAARVVEDLSFELGRPPETAEVVAALEITPAEYAEAQSAHGCFRPASLDQPLSGATDDRDLGSTLVGADHEFLASEARVMVIPAMESLTERERLVLYLRYYEDRTQAEIGLRLGVGQAQVSRILTSALADLRRALVEPVAS